MQRFLFLLCATLFLFACEPETTNDTDQTDTDNMEQDDAADAAATLDATVNAVQANGGDLTAIPGGAAVSTIDSWMEALDGNEAAEGVTAKLEKLKAELSSGDINGPLTGLMLTALAEETTKVVGSNGNAQTQALVGALRSAGDKLTAAAAQGDDLMSKTVAAVRSNNGNITAIPGEAAVATIDAWMKQVATVDGGEDINEELKELKAALTAGTIDGEKVAEHLKNLAESTRSVANGNAGLEALAFALETGYWKLTEK